VFTIQLIYNVLYISVYQLVVRGRCQTSALLMTVANSSYYYVTEAYSLSQLEKIYNLQPVISFVLIKPQYKTLIYIVLFCLISWGGGETESTW
jgi:hypothetical protein